MGLSAGDLRHRVVFEEREETQDLSSGEIVFQWKFFSKAWAQISPISGREFLSASEEMSVVTTRIKVRFNSKINSKMRVRHKDKLYNVHAALADNESGEEWMTLYCSEGATDGR